MTRRKRHGQRKHTGKHRHGAGEEGRIKPRNPLVLIVRRLGHMTHPDRHGERRHPKHRGREPW